MTKMEIVNILYSITLQLTRWTSLKKKKQKNPAVTGLLQLRLLLKFLINTFPFIRLSFDIFYEIGFVSACRISKHHELTPSDALVCY